MTEKEKHESIIIQDLLRRLAPPKTKSALTWKIDYLLRTAELDPEIKKELRKDFKKITKIQQQSHNQIRLIKNDIFLKFCGEPYILDDIK